MSWCLPILQSVFPVMSCNFGNIAFLLLVKTFPLFHVNLYCCTVPLGMTLLSIHGSYHLDINLELIQRGQHPVSAVRPASQIDQIYLKREGQTAV